MIEKSGLIDLHVGQRMRAERKKLKMTQTSLGNMLGVTYQQVQAYEKGNCRVDLSRLIHVSIILKVPVSLFFDGF